MSKTLHTTARNYMFPIGGGSMVVCGECRDIHVADEPDMADAFVRISRRDAETYAELDDTGFPVCGACGQIVGTVGHDK